MADSTARAIWGKAGICSNKKDKWYKGIYSESRTASGACDMFNVVTWSSYSQNVTLLLLLPTPVCAVSSLGGQLTCVCVTNPVWVWALWSNQHELNCRNLPCSSVWLSPCCCALPEPAALLGLFPHKPLCAAEVRTCHFRWSFILAHVNHELTLFLFMAI